MRSSANSILCFLSALFICCFAVSSLAFDERATSSSSLLETDEYTIVRFQAVCSECQDGLRSSLPFELRVHKARAACDGTGIYLNGKDIVHTWDGNSGQGSGLLDLYSGDSDAVLSATWEGICSTGACNGSSSGQCMAQFVTVRIEQLEDEEPGANLSFGISLYSGLSPAILDLSSPPWELIHPTHMESWRERAWIECMGSEPGTPNAEESQPAKSIESLWNRLQDLKTESHDLDQILQEEEQKIRVMLQESCPNENATKWKDCTSFSCKLKLSLSKLPEIIRQIRQWFVPLPSSLPDSFCSQCPHHPQCAQHTDADSNSPGEETAPSKGLDPPQASLSPMSSTNTDYTDLVKSNDLLSDDEIIDIFAIGAAVILTGSISFLTFVICQNSVYCRRRRADRAARREERQTLWAYKRAARRLRWRQWCEGLRHHFLPANLINATNNRDGNENTPLHDLPAIELPDPTQHSNHEPSLAPSDPGIMQTEIWGFRQALEYVGELVRNPAPAPDPDPDLDLDLESAYPRTGLTHPNHEIVELFNKRRSRAPTAASSTAGLSTVMSLRTSSFMSLDTPSCVTLDTLETADTAPPSYHP